MASVWLPTPRGPAERDRQRHDGADGAAHRDNPRRGMVVRGGSGQDHHDPLAQAHAALSQAERLAALFLRRRAHEGGVGGQLVGSAHARSEQDQQRDGQPGAEDKEDEDGGSGDGQRPHESQPGRRGHEAAERDRADGLSQSLGGQDHADGDGAATDGPGERGDDTFGGVVERREPAEQHGGAQDSVAEHQAGPGHDPGQPG
jgi:hypothetical protein